MPATQSLFVWLVMALAIFAANLPFVSQRLFGVIPLKPVPSPGEGDGARPRKTLAIRLFELVVLYFLVGGAGLFMEQRLGRIAPQNWEFYAVTGALFITLAFPGFVWRYLLKHRD